MIIRLLDVIVCDALQHKNTHPISWELPDIMSGCFGIILPRPHIHPVFANMDQATISAPDCVLNCNNPVTNLECFGVPSMLYDLFSMQTSDERANIQALQLQSTSDDIWP